VVKFVPEQEKQLVFNEMFRLLLKPGSRLLISDTFLTAWPFKYAGCISGASSIECYEKYLQQADFQRMVQTL
jgi:arsenite methyltransferase